MFNLTSDNKLKSTKFFTAPSGCVYSLLSTLTFKNCKIVSWFSRLSLDLLDFIFWFITVNKNFRSVPPKNQV